MSDKSIKIRIKLDTHHPETEPSTTATKSTLQIDPSRMVHRNRHQKRAITNMMSIAVLVLGIGAAGYWWAQETPDLVPVATTTSTQTNASQPVTTVEATLVKPTVDVEVAEVVLTRQKPNTQQLVTLAESKLETLQQPDISEEIKEALPQLVQTTSAPAIDEPKPMPLMVKRKAPTQTVIHSQHIQRAQLTKAIDKREPVDEVSGTIYATDDITRMFYFTELKGLRGKVVTHRWELNGKVMAQVRFRIGSDNWRTYSSKYLNKRMMGDWAVVVLNDDGKELSRTEFSYQNPSEALSLR